MCRPIWNTKCKIEWLLHNFLRIVGNKDNGVLLGEKEYEKMRKEFYAQRAKGTTVVKHAQPKTKQALAITSSSSDSSEAMVSMHALPQQKTFNGTTLISKHTTPMELLKTYLSFVNLHNIVSKPVFPVQTTSNKPVTVKILPSKRLAK